MPSRGSLPLMDSTRWPATYTYCRATVSEYRSALRLSRLQLPLALWQKGAPFNGIAERGLHSTIGAG